MAKKVLSRPNTKALAAIRKQEDAEAFITAMAEPVDHGFLHQAGVYPGRVAFTNGSSIMVVHSNSKADDYSAAKFDVVLYDEAPESYVGVIQEVAGIAQMTGAATVVPGSAVPPGQR